MSGTCFLTPSLSCGFVEFDRQDHAHQLCSRSHLHDSPELHCACRNSGRVQLAQGGHDQACKIDPPQQTILSAAGQDKKRKGTNTDKNRTRQAQERVQYLVKLFFKTIQAHPVYERAAETGILRVPLSEGWESRSFVTQVVPVWTRPNSNLFLVFHLQMAKYCAYPIDFPVVPKGAPRVRCVFHNHNTDAEVEGLARTLYEWAQEMLDIEDGKVTNKIPMAARRAIAWTSEAETNGNGVHV